MQFIVIENQSLQNVNSPVNLSGRLTLTALTVYSDI